MGRLCTPQVLNKWLKKTNAVQFRMLFYFNFKTERLHELSSLSLFSVRKWSDANHCILLSSANNTSVLMIIIMLYIVHRVPCAEFTHAWRVSTQRGWPMATSVVRCAKQVNTNVFETKNHLNAWPNHMKREKTIRKSSIDRSWPQWMTKIGLFSTFNRSQLHSCWLNGLSIWEENGRMCAGSARLNSLLLNK